LLVVGSLIGAVGIAAAALWSADRADNVSAPRWVAAAAQGNVRYSSSPLKLSYAREDARGWGIVMKGDDVPCRGLGRGCHYVAFRLGPPSTKAGLSGSCETLAPCEAHVVTPESTDLISSCGQSLMADWSADGHVDATFPHRCYQEVGAAPLSTKSCASGIIKDWFPDGWIGQLYPLACYAAAFRLVPSTGLDYSSPRDDIQAALDLARSGRLTARPDKEQAVFDIKAGMTRAAVEALAGKPFKRGPVCWIYHAHRTVQPNVTGLRVCFTNGVVASTQTSVHL
jgi:hypothetical protein